MRSDVLRAGLRPPVLARQNRRTPSTGVDHPVRVALYARVSTRDKAPRRNSTSGPGAGVVPDHRGGTR